MFPFLKIQCICLFKCIHFSPNTMKCIVGIWDGNLQPFTVNGEFYCDKINKLSLMNFYSKLTLAVCVYRSDLPSDRWRNSGPFNVSLSWGVAAPLGQLSSTQRRHKDDQQLQWRHQGPLKNKNTQTQANSHVQFVTSPSLLVLSHCRTRGHISTCWTRSLPMESMTSKWASKLTWAAWMWVCFCNVFKLQWEIEKWRVRMRS